jgi:two-component system, LytTR family, response regulator
MNAVIIEDSKLAILELKELLLEHSDIKIIAHAGDVDSAIIVIEKHRPELVFLDINMPGGNGFDVLEGLDYTPQVIFTTAYDEYAIKSFEYNALDYLLKPINPQRLSLAIDKIHYNDGNDGDNPLQSPPKTLNGHDKIFVKQEDNCWLVELSNVRLFEAEGNSCALYFEDHKANVSRSLNKIEQRLSEQKYIRVNRQQIVNLDFVKDLQVESGGGFLMTLSCGKEITTSRRSASLIKQMMSF